MFSNCFKTAQLIKKYGFDISIYSNYIYCLVLRSRHVFLTELTNFITTTRMEEDSSQTRFILWFQCFRTKHQLSWQGPWFIARYLRSTATWMWTNPLRYKHWQGICPQAASNARQLIYHFQHECLSLSDYSIIVRHLHGQFTNYIMLYGRGRRGERSGRCDSVWQGKGVRQCDITPDKMFMSLFQLTMRLKSS